MVCGKVIDPTGWPIRTIRFVTMESAKEWEEAQKKMPENAKNKVTIKEAREG